MLYYAFGAEQNNTQNQCGTLCYMASAREQLH